MNNQLQSVTLQTAVLMQVKEFANANKPFSVHDITREIRHKVNQGLLEVPEVEVYGASFRFDIPHIKVKALFDELWRNGVFDPDFSLNRSFVSGMYFQYTPSPVAKSSTPAPSFAITAPTIIRQPAATTTNTSVPPYMSVTNAKGVQLYLNNCIKKNFCPTLKQIQSAIKRDQIPGQTCNELKSYVETLGYTVVNDPDAISQSQVLV
jgi:hypothetical protein